MPRESKLPKQLQPMLATLIDAPFDSPDWVFETKWDGFRLVARIEKRSVTLYSRNGLVVSDNYKPIAKALEKVKRDAVIDGELVAFDAHGISRFQLLQNALRTVTNLHYCAFDIMSEDGQDLRALPLAERKARLKKILPKGKRQEVVIVGFTAPRRSRPHFGALVLAVRDGKDWRYAGHVGTGFSHAALKSIYDKLSALRARTSPFKQKVKDEANTTWVKPRLVAEVKFTEWTDAGEMRHPAFLGLREDKRAEDVVREKEAVSKRR